MKLLQNSKIYHKFTESVWYAHLSDNLLKRNSTYYSIYEARVSRSIFDQKLKYWEITTVPNHTGIHDATT